MQQQLAPASGSAAPTTSQHHRLYSDSLISPYNTLSQNPNLNSIYSHVLPYYSTGVSTLIQQPPNLDPNSALNINHYTNTFSNEGAHQLGLAHLYLQSAAVAQNPNVLSQPYAVNLFQPVKTNPFIVPQKSIQWKNKPKKTKAVQLLQCEICKVDCNSATVLYLHNIGSKHKKNLQKLGLAAPIVPADNTVLNQHLLVNNNHDKKLEQFVTKNSNPQLAWWCEVCGENYNSKTVLDQHKLGKKHKKNVEKLTPVSSSNSIILKNSGEAATSSTFEQRTQKKTDGSDDLETKKMKVIQGGAAPQAVCTCPVCDVVCNSVEVFKYHLAGKKHIAMVMNKA